MKKTPLKELLTAEIKSHTRTPWPSLATSHPSTNLYIQTFFFFPLRVKSQNTSLHCQGYSTHTYKSHNLPIFRYNACGCQGRTVRQFSGIWSMLPSQICAAGYKVHTKYVSAAFWRSAIWQNSSSCAQPRRQSHLTLDTPGFPSSLFSVLNAINQQTTKSENFNIILLKCKRNGNRFCF